jgi:hypothetical protein
MLRNVKSKVSFRCLNSKAFFVSLLFVAVLVSSCFIAIFDNGVSLFALGASDKIVSNEMELKYAVYNAVGPTVIALDNDITLTEQIVIPVDKDITLTSTSTSKFFKLIGGYRDIPSNPYNPYYPTPVIIVQGAGVLRLDGITVTCVHFTWNEVVRVDVCGTLILYNGEILGSDVSGDGVDNSGVFTMLGGTIANVKPEGQGHGWGSGVYNSEYGTFSMSGGEISNNTVGVCNRRILDRNGFFELTGGVISNNDDCGVQNSGNFSMSGGTISNNMGKNSMQSGGGISNSGIFSMLGGVITNNQATYGGGVYNWPDGDFSLAKNGVISNNNAEVGGGLYNAGTFNRRDGVISDNTATYYSDIYHSDGSITIEDNIADDGNVLNSDKTMDSFFVVLIVVIVSIVTGGVFFYFKKSTKNNDHQTKPATTTQYTNK